MPVVNANMENTPDDSTVVDTNIDRSKAAQNN